MIDSLHSYFEQNNVLVADDGTLKINDFDYAVLSESTLRFSKTTRQGGGTMRWMVRYTYTLYMFAHLSTQAPELLQPEEDSEDGEAGSAASRTKESDIYALGMASWSNPSAIGLPLTLLFSDYAGKSSE